MPKWNKILSVQDHLGLPASCLRKCRTGFLVGGSNCRETSGNEIYNKLKHYFSNFHPFWTFETFFCCLFPSFNWDEIKVDLIQGLKPTIRFTLDTFLDTWVFGKALWVSSHLKIWRNLSCKSTNSIRILTS